MNKYARIAYIMHKKYERKYKVFSLIVLTNRNKYDIMTTEKRTT